ncbi:MAG: FkbM family methyltransferase [Planctomycetes bacterium]|nr:FkbM family methyltransferase [Planctomycetota bacterium]
MADRRQDALMSRILERTLEPGSNCIDVGAHRGDVLAQLIKLAPQGRHHAFEPIPQFAKELQARFPCATVHNLALSDSIGEASFSHVVSNPAYSGLRPRTYPRPDEEVRSIQVKTETLDRILPAGEQIDLIKIDVEGAELQVLRGALATLGRCRPVVLFEHGVGASDHYGTSPEMIHRLLVDDCGLQLNEMDRYLKGLPALSLSDFVEVAGSGRVWNFVAHG